MIKNLNSLLELAAGHSYKVLDVTDTVVSVLHRKCGNEFTSTVTDIARAGFSCPRCNETRADKMLTTLQNEHSKELYEAVKAKLPAGYNIFGSTQKLVSLRFVARLKRDIKLLLGIDMFRLRIYRTAHLINFLVRHITCLIHNTENIILVTLNMKILGWLQVIWIALSQSCLIKY